MDRLRKVATHQFREKGEDGGLDLNGGAALTEKRKESKGPAASFILVRSYGLQRARKAEHGTVHWFRAANLGQGRRGTAVNPRAT